MPVLVTCVANANLLLNVAFWLPQVLSRMRHCHFTPIAPHLGCKHAIPWNAILIFNPKQGKLEKAI